MLRILHCQTMQEPRETNLEIMLKIAILADGYRPFEAVGACLCPWINKLTHIIRKEPLLSWSPGVGSLKASGNQLLYIATAELALRLPESSEPKLLERLSFSYKFIEVTIT